MPSNYLFKVNKTTMLFYSYGHWACFKRVEDVLKKYRAAFERLICIKFKTCHLAFTFTKSTMETPEQCVKFIQI